MRTVFRTLLICLLAQSAVALAQNNPFSAYNKVVYAGVKTILLRSAEKMPEENYNFKPTDAVRGYGQIIGHVTDAQYMFCSIVLGENNPAPKIEQTKTSKADLIAALKDAFAYCDKAYDGMTDVSGAQMAKLFGGDTPKLGVLSVNNMHSVEHYGNLVTYMRLKNIVPPTSEPGFMPKPKSPTDAASAFEKLKTLQGTWTASMEGTSVQVSLRVTSMGNTLMHEMTMGGRPDDPISMFHLDGDRLMLTHYCDAGNQPRMVGTISPDGKTITFDFIDATNLLSTQVGHMQHVVFNIIDADHHTELWEFATADGKPMGGLLDLKRAK